MIRLLLVALGGWAAWRYRAHLKEYANQFPDVQKKATKALGEAAAKIQDGLQSSPSTARSSRSAGRPESQAKG
jgi:hypothetical protein